MKRIALCAVVLLSASAFAQTVIYSNLNSDPNNVYNASDGYQMGDGAPFGVAVPFLVPNGVSHFSHAVVGFQWVNDDGESEWDVASDANGLPNGAITDGQ